MAGKLDWATIAQLSRGWANVRELALARQMVEQLDALPEGESGRLFVAFDGKDEIAKQLDALFRDRTVLGLTATSGVPEKPKGPAVGCKVSLSGEPGKLEATVRLASSGSKGGNEWAPAGKFTLPVNLDAKGQPDLEAFGDALAEGIMNRLVRALFGQEAEPGRPLTAFHVRIENASPMILNGISLISTEHKANDVPRYLLGINVAPGRNLSLSITNKAAQEYGLKKGIQLVGLDLSGL